MGYIMKNFEVFGLKCGKDVIIQTIKITAIMEAGESPFALNGMNTQHFVIGQFQRVIKKD